MPPPLSPSSPAPSCSRLLPPQPLSLHKQHQLDAPAPPLGDPCSPPPCTPTSHPSALPAPPSSPCFAPRHLPSLPRLLHGCLPASTPALPTIYPLTGAKAIFIKGNSDHHLPALNPPKLLRASGRCPNSSPRVTKPQVIRSLPTCPNRCSVAGPSLPGQPPAPPRPGLCVPCSSDLRPLPWLCPLPGPSLLLHLTQPLLTVPSSALNLASSERPPYPQHRKRPGHFCSSLSFFRQHDPPTTICLAREVSHAGRGLSASLPTDPQLLEQAWHGVRGCAASSRCMIRSTGTCCLTREPAAWKPTNRQSGRNR